MDLFSSHLGLEIAARFVGVALLVHFALAGIKCAPLSPRFARLRFWLLPGGLPFLIGSLLGGIVPPVTEEGIVYLSFFYSLGLGAISGGFSSLIYATVHRVLSGDPRALLPGRYPKERPPGES